MTKHPNKPLMKGPKSALAAHVAEHLIEPSCNDYIGPKASSRPTLRLIVESTAHEYGLHFEQLTLRTRVQRVLEPRQIAMWLAHRVFGYTCCRVGNYVGGRHHTTVLHASNLIDLKRSQDKELSAHIERIVQHIEYNNNIVPENRLPRWRSDNLRPSAITGQQAHILATNQPRDGQSSSQVMSRGAGRHSNTPLPNTSLSGSRPSTQLADKAETSNKVLILALRQFLKARHKRDRAPTGRQKIDAAGQERVAYENLVDALACYDEAVAVGAKKAM